MKSNLLLLLLIGSLNAFGQITIPTNIKIPLDSLEKELLKQSLDAFLEAADKGDKNDANLLASEKLATLLLLDEMQGITSNQAIKPYLLNMIEQEDNSYLLQVSYLEIQNNEPVLKAALQLVAHKDEESFKFSTPLRRNTSHWKAKQISNTTFYYQGSLHLQNATVYVEKTAEFDAKLELPQKNTAIYLTDNLTDLFKLIGIDYLAAYNGRRYASTMASLKQDEIVILGNGNPSFETFDTHDLWHDRLALAVNRRKTHRPVDEACAYLYGGSWGYSWEEILSRFKAKYASQKDIDWKYYKENPENFGESQENHLMADYVVNALIVDQLEKDKGFWAVLELLKAGPYEKGNANYYRTLEKLTGTNQEGYSDMVWGLINSSK